MQFELSPLTNEAVFSSAKSLHWKSEDLSLNVHLSKWTNRTRHDSLLNWLVFLFFSQCLVVLCLLSDNSSTVILVRESDLLESELSYKRTIGGIMSFGVYVNDNLVTRKICCPSPLPFVQRKPCPYQMQCKPKIKQVKYKLKMNWMKFSEIRWNESKSCGNCVTNSICLIREQLSWQASFVNWGQLNKRLK